MRLDTIRAEFAFTSAQNGAEGYAPAVQELRTMLRINGLRATMAYLFSKEGQHLLLFQQICAWLNKFDTQLLATEEQSKVDADNLSKICAFSDDQYRIATAEVSAFSLWLNQFVKTEHSK